MEQQVREYVAAKAKEMINAVSCSAEAKAAAESWLAAMGTDKEAEETKNLLPNWSRTFYQWRLALLLALPRLAFSCLAQREPRR